MSEISKKIGIVAGGGQFPLLFAEAATQNGYQVVAVAHEGETDPELNSKVEKTFWVKLGQLGKLIKHFKNEGITETVLLGSITKTRIFKDVWPDLRAMSLWNKIDTRQDDAILRAVAHELEKDGIKVVESTFFLQDLLFPKGVLTKNRPSSDEADDIAFGWQIARATGKLDIGQCVVVRNRSVLAVEAIEGTDAAIKRGGELGKEKVVVVKLKKPDQDFRFDLPAVGLETIKTMAGVKGRVLAVEAGQAVLFDRPSFITAAEQAGIIVIGVEEGPDGELIY